MSKEPTETIVATEPVTEPVVEPVVTEEVVIDPAKEEPTQEETKEGEEPTTEEGEEPSEEEPETTEEPEAELDTTVWGDTGSEVGNSTLNLLQNAGVTTEEAKSFLYDAVVAGDVTKIDEAALEAKIGKAKATLVMTGVKGFITETAEKNAAIKQVVYDTVGGEETWNKVADWAKTSDVDISEYAPMIDAGGAQARFAAQEITGLYNADPNNTAVTSASNPRVEPSKGGAAPAIKPITRTEFVEQLDAAHQAGDQKAVDRIKAARRAGRNQGI